MIKELSGKDRRKWILSIIENSETPVSGAEIGRITSVSRQVIVQDIALLRTEGNRIMSTSMGYYIEKSQIYSRILKVCHTDKQLNDELETIVDLGGIVRNVIINHRVYGRMEAELNIKSRRDIAFFVENIKTGKSVPLLNVTSGYHFHKIEAESNEILDEIESALKKKGYLAEQLPYERIQ